MLGTCKLSPSIRPADGATSVYPSFPDIFNPGTPWDFNSHFVCTCTELSHPACTFLGPSRKRGPPKGYIDAIESRLHQTEALVGILLSLANPGRGVLDGGKLGVSNCTVI